MMRLMTAMVFVILLPATAIAKDLPRIPSKSEPVQQSLANLLNDGWKTNDGSAGLGGTNIVVFNRDS